MATAASASPSTRYGLMAEFDSADALLAAAKKTTSAGYTRTDAYSPTPVHGLAEAIGFHEHLVPKLILGGGISGLAAGFGLQYWTQVIAYPMNIGGRPTYSWVSWIPPMFELTILFAASAAVFGMLALNGLPQPYHPVFNAPRFNLEQTKAFLTGLQARGVVEVEE